MCKQLKISTKAYSLLPENKLRMFFPWKQHDEILNYQIQNIMILNIFRKKAMIYMEIFLYQDLGLSRIPQQRFQNQLKCFTKIMYMAPELLTHLTDIDKKISNFYMHMQYVLVLILICIYMVLYIAIYYNTYIVCPTFLQIEVITRCRTLIHSGINICRQRTQG